MNDQPSPAARPEDEGPPSPKRKKVRAKYAPKACVSCRRSKLKCSGENPCRRCLDNGKRCFYSEDQTAAEALQNLSRPTPVQAPLTAMNTNGNGMSRRSILPRHDGIERRASDASLLGLSMEARMARVESMMEALMQERGIAITPRVSAEREDAASDCIQNDFAMHMPVDSGMLSFVPTAQTSYVLDSTDRARHSVSGGSPMSTTDPGATIRVGNRNYAFPSLADYQRYLGFFFTDLGTYYPCVNETDFRIRSDAILAAPSVQADNASLLALNYIIFACCDIALDTSSSNTQNKPPGWQWFRASDELVGKRKMSGRADLCLIQFLVLEAVYLTFADKANAAYSIIGIACRLCFQSSLHQKSSWRAYTPFDVHMRQRIFWTVYVLDRRISLSCGRPYSIRESDIDIEQPVQICDKDIHPDQPLPEPDLYRSSNVYLNSMICWSRLAGDVWDGLFAATIAKDGVDSDNARMYNDRIKHWSEAIRDTIPLLPTGYLAESRKLRQQASVHNSMDQLRLLLFRQSLLSLQYNGELERLCGDLALNIVQRIQTYNSEENQLGSFRFCMASSLGSAVLVLSVLLTGGPTSVGSRDRWEMYANGYREAMMILGQLASSFTLARRILDDFAAVERVLDDMMGTEQPYPHHVPTNIRDMFPYTCLDFSQQSTASGGDVPTDGQAVESGAESTLNTDLWSSVFTAKEGKYGVPWV